MSIWDVMDTTTLMTASLACRKFLQLSQHPTHWRRLCWNRFRTKQLSILLTGDQDQLKALSIESLKGILQRRQQQGWLTKAQVRLFSSHLEKSDLVSLVRDSCPSWMSPIFQVSDLRWSVLWKLNYALLLWDSKRSFILRSELANCEWRFQFLQRVFPTSRTLPTFWGRFASPSMAYTSNLFEEGVQMQWRLLGDDEGFNIIPTDPHEWDVFDEDDYDEETIKARIQEVMPGIKVFSTSDPPGRLSLGGSAFSHFSVFGRWRKVQVADYPPLAVFRHQNGWLLANMFVVFRIDTSSS